MTTSTALPHTDTAAWSGRDVSVAQVVDAVDGLRCNEQKAATRTSVANLIIVTRTTDEVDEAETVIEHLGVRHPARIITLLAAHGAGQGPDRVDADVVLHAGQAAGHSIWSDELRLRVSGGPARHLASLLRPLLLSDLPTVVWYVHGLPDGGDPLLKAASAVIVDTKTAADLGEGEPAMHRAFEKASALAHRNTIIDLSWTRTRPWRQLLAAQFDGEAFRPFVSGTERVEITGKLGPRTLLAGWLAAQLGLSRDVFHLYDGRHLSIALSCTAAGRQARFTVNRVPGERLVQASVAVENGPANDELLALPDDALPYSLAAALKRLEPDALYERTIETIGGWGQPAGR